MGKHKVIDLIKKTIPNKQGVYCITNTENGKRYVGGSMNMRSRLRSHAYAILRGSSKNMSHELNERNIESVRFEVLEPVDDLSSLYWVEEKWKDRFSSVEYGYNKEEGKPPHRWI